MAFVLARTLSSTTPSFAVYLNSILSLVSLTKPTMRSLRPTPVDGYPTDTSTLQATTENVLQSHWAKQVAGDTNHVVALKKDSHVQFLLRNLVQGFPPRYTSQDASQPWLIFWTLQGFSVLGVGLDEQTKRRYVVGMIDVSQSSPCAGRSTRFLLCSILPVVLLADQASSLTYCQPMHRCVRWQSQEAVATMADGIRLIGAGLSAYSAKALIVAQRWAV